MVKKSVKKLESNEVSFDELNSIINSASSYGGLMSEVNFSKIEDWIDTGNYTLNAVLSGDIFKGIPAGRITLISGLTSTGKTFLSLNSAKRAQDNGYFIIWIDTEAAIDPTIVSQFGIDLTKFRHELLNKVSEVSTFIKKITAELKTFQQEKRKLPKVMIVLDSIGNLSTSKEISDIESGSEKADMTRAKEIKRLFRALTVDMAVLNIPFVAINHTYTSIGSFIATQVQGGGCLTENEEILMENGSYKNINNISTGEFVQTLNGLHEVLATHKFENKEIVELEFDNGRKIKCTPEHKFLVGFDLDNNKIWKTANELNENDEIKYIAAD